MRAEASSSNHRLSIHLHLVYYIVNISTIPLLLYDPLLFLLLYPNHIMLYKTLSHNFHTMLFYFTDIMVNIYLCTFLCVYILLLLSCFGYSLYILLLSIILWLSMLTMQLSHIPVFIIKSSTCVQKNKL